MLSQYIKNFSIKNIMQDEKKVKILTVSAIMVVLLIFISSISSINIIPDKNEDSEKGVSGSVGNSVVSVDKYISNLEDKVANFLQGISGVGEVRVMVTLENEMEYVYQSQVKESSQENGRDYEEEIIIIDNGGENKALIQTIKPPKIQAIAVCCDGGADPRVEVSVMQVLTKAFALTSSQVSVSATK